MKALKLNNIPKNIITGFLVTFMAFTFSACAKKISFLPSAVAPAAEGRVKLTKDDNNNYAIQIELENLAESKRLTPPRQTYVVWMVTDQNVTKNIGQINSTTGLLSDRLRASFETVSSVKPTKIFITAEDDASIQYPGMQMIMTTATF
jgi:hypothetical protein